MKPQFTPLIRSGARLLALDVEEMALSWRNRRRLLWKPGYQPKMQDYVWPSARWWKHRSVSDIEDLPESLDPARDRALLRCWNRLATVSSWSTDVLADILVVLVEAPFVETTYSPAIPDPFAGAIDLRPWLSDRRHIADLLSDLAGNWNEAIDSLCERKLISEEIAMRLRRLRPNAEYCPDPYALAHLRCRGDIRTISWTQFEVRGSLPFHRSGSIRKVRRAIRIVERLLTIDDYTSAALQRFLVAGNPAETLAWLQFADQLGKLDHQRILLQRLTQARMRQCTPGNLSPVMLREIKQRFLDSVQTNAGIETALSIMDQGTPHWAQEDLLTLARGLSWCDFRNHVPSRCRYRVPVAPLIEAGRLLIQQDGKDADRYDSGPRVTLRLWERAVGSPSLCQILERETWREFEPDTIRFWFRLYLRLDQIWDRSARCRLALEWIEQLARGDEAARQRVRIESLLCLVGLFSDHLSGLLVRTIDKFSDTIALGFEQTPHSALALWCTFYRHGNLDQRWGLGRLNRAALKAMADATRTYTISERIESGVAPFLSGLPDWNLDIPFRRPKLFLRVLREFGDLSPADRTWVIGYLEGHPAFGVDPLRIRLGDAALLFATITPSGRRNPLPEKLRMSATDTAPLRPDIESHYREEFACRLAEFQIETFHQAIQERLDCYRAENLDPHSIVFASHLGKTNRRALKRLLFAIRTGNHDYRDLHPANRSWLEKKTDLDLREWTRAETDRFSVEIEGTTDPAIRLEDDPQEELKMGSYVGSCLSIGGCNQHSAIANTLDINKRIAYLRDESGKVLARQLLAISEEGELVPFDVYYAVSHLPDCPVERAFLQFDLHLSGLLGLPLRRKDQPYTIPSLLVSDWYDDYAWDITDGDLASAREGSHVTRGEPSKRRTS